MTIGDGSVSTNIENSIYVDDKVMWLDYQQYTIGVVENTMGSKAVCYRNGGSGTDNGYTYNIGDGVENCYVNSMSFDGDDIYVCGFVGDDNKRSKIWKNGEVIMDFVATEVPMQKIEVNHQGIYTIGDDKVSVDGEVVYATELTSALCVETECVDNHDDLTVTVFEDNFERGDSNWACWTSYDIDDANYGYQSFWHRSSKFAADGDLGHGWFIDDVKIEGTYNEDIEEYYSENQYVSPNPASEFIHLEGFENGYDIEVFNSLGQRVLTKKHSENEIIDVSDFVSGVYYIKGKSHSTKFIVE